MATLMQKRADALEYAGVTVFALYFVSLATMVVAYVRPF